MKTQQELMQAYWGPGGTVDMIKAYNAKHGCDVKPWECVKYEGNSSLWQGDHPRFDGQHYSYSFALAILYDDKRREHRPVFVGETLYFNECGDSKYTVKENGYSVHGEYIHGYDWRRNDLSSWSWNPPTPKRTFKLNNLELPCPTYKEGGHMLEITCNYDLYRMNNVYIFDSAKDRDEVEKALHNLLAPETRSKL